MKPRIFVTVVCMPVLLAACKKTNETGVQLRVQNSTSQNFTEIITNGKSFRGVSPGAVTSYQSFDRIVDAPFVILINGADTAYAGVIYYDPPINYIENGNYTLDVFEDTSTYYDYNCKYIKN
jgi:hypothetical protein